VFDHTLLLLLLVLMIATLLLFLLSFSLSLAFETQEEHSAREEDDRMGDGRCGVFEKREKTTNTNATEEEREEEKKVPQKSGNLENEPTQGFFFLHFFPPLSSAFWCCPLPLKFCSF
jgi:hypothetical protein